MDINKFLNDVRNFQEYSRKSKILLFAYYLRQYEGIIEFRSRDMQRCFKESLSKVPSDLGLLLKDMAKGKNSRLMRGSNKLSFSLSHHGLNEVEKYLTSKVQTTKDVNTEAEVDSFLDIGRPYLEKILQRIGDDTQKKFMAEAIACLGVDAKRSTIIMVWAGTIAHLYNYILLKKVKDFNSALKKRSDKFKKLEIKVYDDFSDIPDSIFLEVAKSGKVITNDVRKILEEKLGIRNTCAHPSDIEIHKTKVINFIEDIIDNIIIKYKI